MSDNTSRETYFTRLSEDIFIEYLLSNYDTFTRCQGVTSPEIFKYEDNQNIIRTLIAYAEKYNELPSREQLQASLGLERVGAPEYEPARKGEKLEWFFDQYEDFVRYKNIGISMEELFSMHDSGDYDSMLARLKQATEIGLPKDFGLDWHDDPKARNLALRDGDQLQSTGWKTVDDLLYGGFSRGELNIFVGKSGTGKTVWLNNLAYNWKNQGLKVLYITLELKAEKIAQRIDMIHTSRSTKDLYRDLDGLNASVAEDREQSGGRIQIVKLPGLNTNTGTLKSFIREFEIQKETKFDAIIVDYLDIMVPNSKRISPNEKFMVDQYIATELRELADTDDLLLATASQMNRGGTKAEGYEYDHAHIAGGISKINTADNVMVIISDKSKKDRGDDSKLGYYELKFIKTRSSRGEGYTIKMKYDAPSTRISDLTDEEADAINSEEAVPNPKNSVKRTASVSKQANIYQGDKSSQAADLKKLLNKGKKG